MEETTDICKPTMKKAILALSLAAGLTSLVGTMRAQSIQIQSDLEMSPAGPGEVTQPGWITQGVAKISNTNSSSLTPTQSGLDAGIAASVVGNTNWESRGGFIEGRALVTGTSFNDLVSDFWGITTPTLVIRDSQPVVALFGSAPPMLPFYLKWTVR